MDETLSSCHFPNGSLHVVSCLIMTSTRVSMVEADEWMQCNGRSDLEVRVLLAKEADTDHFNPER